MGTGVRQVTTTPGLPTHRMSLWKRPWFRPLIGLILLLVLLVGDEVVGAAQSGGKISPEIDRSAEVVNVIVDIKFEPRIFHQEELAELGVFAGRDREDRSLLRLGNVSQGSLDKISRLFWVDQILPFNR